VGSPVFTSANLADFLWRLKYEHSPIVWYGICEILAKCSYLFDRGHWHLNHSHNDHSNRDASRRSAPCSAYHYFSLGRTIAFFINKMEQERVRAALIPRLMPKRLVKIIVALNDGKSRHSEGHFWYLELRNTGEEAANQVRPLVNISGEFSGVVGVPIISTYIKDWIQVKSRLGSEDFDSKRERFAFALTTDASVVKPSLNIEGLGAGAFALCFALRDGNQLYIATKKYPIVLSFPVDALMTVYSTGKGLPRHYLGVYRCHGNNWHDCRVEPTHGR
jgi:hypothetical protein